MLGLSLFRCRSDGLVELLDLLGKSGDVTLETGGVVLQLCDCRLSLERVSLVAALSSFDFSSSDSQYSYSLSSSPCSLLRIASIWSIIFMIMPKFCAFMP